MPDAPTPRHPAQSSKKPTSPPPKKTPLERAFGQVQEGLKIVERLMTHVGVWKDVTPPSGDAYQTLGELCISLKDSFGALKDAREEISALQALGYRAPDASAIQPRWKVGAPVAFRKNVVEQYAPFVTQAGDLDYLVVTKLGEKMVAVGVSRGGTTQPLGVVPRGHLVLKREVIQ